MQHAMASYGPGNLLTDNSLFMRSNRAYGMQGTECFLVQCHDTQDHQLSHNMRGTLRCMHVLCLTGSGGGAGWTGGSGGLTGAGTGDGNAGKAAAGTSFLASSVTGTCTGLPGNAGNGYVAVALP